MKAPSSLLEPTEPRVFLPEEQEQKQLFYASMSPRRRKFVDRIGFDTWDPFEAPKEPMDIRQDTTKRTIQQLVQEFMHTVTTERSESFSRGALECAMGLVNKEERYLGIFDFCLWYHQLLQQEKSSL